VDGIVAAGDGAAADQLLQPVGRATFNVYFSAI
jgi:hypothetical protein